MINKNTLIVSFQTNSFELIQGKSYFIITNEPISNFTLIPKKHTNNKTWVSSLLKLLTFLLLCRTKNAILCLNCMHPKLRSIDYKKIAKLKFDQKTSLAEAVFYHVNEEISKKYLTWFVIESRIFDSISGSMIYELVEEKQLMYNEISFAVLITPGQFISCYELNNKINIIEKFGLNVVEFSEVRQKK